MVFYLKKAGLSLTRTGVFRLSLRTSQGFAFALLSVNSSGSRLEPK